MQKYKIRKRIIYFLFLIFIFFSSKCYPDWVCLKTTQLDSNHISACFKFSEKKTISNNHDLSLELFITKEKTKPFFQNYKLYLNNTTFSFFPLNKEKKTKLYISFEHDDPNKYEIIADLLQGNQKLLFDDKTTQLIIENLNSNKKIEIQSGNQQITILPQNFINLYSKFTKN